MKDEADNDEQFGSHQTCMEGLQRAQEADSDMRERAKEAKLFIYDRDGQWQQDAMHSMGDKPKFTFDLTTPIIDQVSGEMEKSDFDIRITPSGGGADDDIAKTYDGILRHIHYNSGATAIYNGAGRETAIGGLSGWRVVQEYADCDSFDQDLLIKRIRNFNERVWFGPHEEPDASDANRCWVITAMTPEDFKAEYPEHDSMSVDSGGNYSAFFHKQNMVLVGEYLYLKPEKIELVKMSDGSVLKVDDDFKATQDEMAEAGITEVARRSREIKVCYSRLFSATDWLTEPEETVFEGWIPVIPCYGNFDLIEEKVVYSGAVEKLLDPQRVFNYAVSREVGEGALAPVRKIMVTDEQVEGHEDQWANLNTSTEPALHYNHVDVVPPPWETGGPQINVGLRSLAQSMQELFSHSSGFFAANMGDNPRAQSGVAIEKLQDRGDMGNNKYVEAREIAQRHTARILMKAIPKVYEPGRQVRLLRDNGDQEAVTIGQRVIDNDTGKVHIMHDLSIGSYDVECRAGPSYKSRQNETVESILKYGQIDPESVMMGGDILLNNIPAPGMDDLAERKREQLFKQGVIPVSQMTEEEKQLYQQMQQQPPQPDPNMVLAQAEDKKAEASLVANQIKLETARNKAMLDEQGNQIKQFEAITKRLSVQIERISVMVDADNKGADTAVKTAEAEGKQLENAIAVSSLQPAQPEPEPEIDVTRSGLEDAAAHSNLEDIQ